MHQELSFDGFFSHAQMGLEIYICDGVVTYVALQSFRHGRSPLMFGIPEAFRRHL